MEPSHDLYQQVILDHNKNPKNYGDLVPCTHESEGYNPLCGDHIWMKLRLNQAGKKIEKIAFTGQCCAISKASASLMTAAVLQQSLTEVSELFEQFRNLVLDKKPADELKAELGKLIVFEGIKRYPARIKCVLLAWHTLSAALTQKKSTESESLY